MNFLWHSGSNGHVNCVVPQGKQIWPLTFVEVCCTQCSKTHPKKWTRCIRKMKSWKSKHNAIFKNIGFIVQDLQYLISLFTRSAPNNIWLSEESFELLQRGQSLGSSALVCPVTLPMYEANKVNEWLLLRSGDQDLFKDCRKNTSGSLKQERNWTIFALRAVRLFSCLSFLLHCFCLGC